MCAGRTAQLLNYSSLANDCGISQPTARAWLGILEASYITFRLPAFSANLRKRLIKMPKLYFYDTGLVCWLLGIRQPEQLRSHPLRGAIFETWVVSEILKHRIHRGIGTSTLHGLSFYRDKNGAEVDLLMEQPDRLILLEAKSAETPSKSLFAGAQRVRRHFQDSPRPCDVAVAYGGEEFQQRTDGRLIPWRMLRTAALPDVKPSVHVFADGEPLADADVLVLFPNKTWKRANTGENGEAHFDLYTSVLPMTVFVAAKGFAAKLVKTWIPAECALHIELKPLPDGGAVIFPQSTGYIPGLAGRLNPIRDSLDRTYLYTDNIAINGGKQKPVSFLPGEEMHLVDANGKEMLVRIVDIVGQSALVEYRPCPSSTPTTTP